LLLPLQLTLTAVALPAAVIASSRKMARKFCRQYPVPEMACRKFSGSRVCPAENKI
jgi:hypothetical protein